MNGSDAKEFFFNGPAQKVLLDRVADTFAVRFQPNVRTDDPRLSRRARDLLRGESEHIGFVPRYGLQIFRASNSGDADRRVRELAGEAAVASALPVLRWSRSLTDTVILDNRFLIEFRADVGEAQAMQELRRLNDRFGVKILERLGYAHPAIGFHLEAPMGEGERGPLELAKRYFETGLLRYAIPELIQRRAFRNVVPAVRDTRLHDARELRNVPTLASQWHLQKANVVGAWQQAGTTGSPSIVVAIADDGVDVDHPEFSGKVVAQYDFDADVPDATPKLGVDRHGTACAGVAVARGASAPGVAPGCSLLAVRFPEQLGVSDEARMFQWMADNGADVISCSWGPPDGTFGTHPLPGNVASAIEYCVTRGRGGKGIPVFWAAGNGNESVSTDGYAANPNVIAVSACTEADTKAHYSDFGVEVAVCAPSSGTRSAGHRAIFTTDRRGSVGYNPGTAELGDPTGNYTNDFGGTSSAAPLVAGVAGLLLSVDAALTWRQVKEILMQTATKIGEGYDGAGHSDVFGHGRVDALAAVRMVQEGRIPTPAAASIEGPETASRFGEPPAFRVAVPAGRYHALELTMDPALFDARERRTPDNFFASWRKEGLSASSSVRVPSEFWPRFKTAERLFYRLLTSSSPTAWTDVQIVPTIGGGTGAPSVELVPSIRGPVALDRSAPAPAFDVRIGPGQWYAVELATDPALFDVASRRPARTEANFYASWSHPAGLWSESPYRVPAAAWASLSQAPRVYYRLLISHSASQWLDTLTLPDATELGTSAFVQIDGSV